MDYIDTLKLFIRAERVGNWSMHIIAVGRMLNLFAATGHFNYAKSTRMYLQLMLELPAGHPWLHIQFKEHGYHTVRRSDRYWAGLWTDLTICQVMMHSFKSRGGLTRGRGITDTVKLLWVYNMHKGAEVHEAMTDVTGLVHRTSEQHVELGNTSCNRDVGELNTILKWLAQHNPLDIQRPELRSLSSWLTASDGDGVNCDEVEEIGFFLKGKLDDVKYHEASMKRILSGRVARDSVGGEDGTGASRSAASIVAGVSVFIFSPSSIVCVISWVFLRTTQISSDMSCVPGVLGAIWCSVCPHTA